MRPGGQFIPITEFDLSRNKNRFEAKLKEGKKLYYLGLFPTDLAAAKAWNEAARHHRGADAYQNRIDDRRQVLLVWLPSVVAHRIAVVDEITRVF